MTSKTISYIPDVQKTLEKHQRTKESVLSHLDSNWKQLSQSVNRLVENISGKYDKENNKNLAEKTSQEIRIHYAKAQYEQSVCIEGTLAEKYLQTFRGITGVLPSSFRYHPGVRHLNTKKLTPALIAPIHDKDNSMTGIVRIFLNADGSKLKESYKDKHGKVQVAIDKANLGLWGNAAVIVQKGESEALWMAEGIETALSVAKAVPNQTVVASLSPSNLKNVPVSKDIQKIMICVDQDPQSNTTGNIIEAVERYLSLGKSVFIAMPPEIPLGMKQYDFNDLLRQKGISNVKTVLNAAIEIKSAELLKNPGINLAIKLEKIRGTGVPLKSALNQESKGISAEKLPIQLER